MASSFETPIKPEVPDSAEPPAVERKRARFQMFTGQGSLPLGIATQPDEDDEESWTRAMDSRQFQHDMRCAQRSPLSQQERTVEDVIVKADEMMLDFEAVKIKKVEAVMARMKTNVADGKLYVDIDEKAHLFYEVYATIFRNAGYKIQCISTSTGGPRGLATPLTIVRVSLITLPE